MRRIRIIMLALTAFAAITAADNVCARRVKTRLKAKTAQEMAETEKHVIVIDVQTPDTLGCRLEDIVYTGYDKPLASDRESVHISNHAQLPLSAISVEIIYTDTRGRRLHKRTVSLDPQIEPGETLKVDFKTWDPQHSFYYLRSPRPRRQATPYTVTFRTLRLTFEP